MTVLAGRYTLGEPLGSGGMSRVVTATDEVLGRRVAVKLIRADLVADRVVRERLVREARAAASLTHPNAVAVFDTGEDDGTPFIVMELVEGGSLAERLGTEGALPVEDAIRIAGEVLSALEAAHHRGLVHRDVKPANVLLSADGTGAKLADFGIAKGIADAAAGLTSTGQVIGTPRYLAPEQVEGAPPTPSSDIYAVGVLCYEMLSGAPPFDGPSPIAIAMAHQNREPPPLADRAQGVPVHIVDAVHRALAKAPSARFSSAAAMRTALGVPGSARMGMEGRAGASADTTVALTDGSADTTVALAGASAATGSRGNGGTSTGDTGSGRTSAWRKPLIGLLAVLALVAVVGFALSDRGTGDVREEGTEEAVDEEPAPPVEPDSPPAGSPAPEVDAEPGPDTDPDTDPDTEPDPRPETEPVPVPEGDGEPDA